MLSRIAESLFWVGRYLERAEGTARLLEVQLHALLEDAPHDERIAPQSLLSVMGIAEPADGPKSLPEVTALLAFSREEPSSIVSSLIGARENARGIRESLSSELWECLNATYVALDQQIVSEFAIGPHGFFQFAQFVKERVAIAAGICDATMSRDDSWRFLVLGKSLERVDMTARLLGARISLPGTTADWATTLRCCSAYEAFLRTYRGAVTAMRSTEFLLLDRLFPRSIYAALATAESCLLELDPEQGRLGSDDEAQRILGRVRAALEYRSILELFRELPHELLSLQAACSDASLAIASRYFQRDATLAWRTEQYADSVSTKEAS